jgi:hypothetical protein
MLLVGLATPSLRDPAKANDQCEPSPHHCTDAVAACCCQTVPTSTVAISPFVSAWSTVNKALWQAVVWTADAARGSDIDRPSGRLLDTANRSYPPATPLSSSEASTVLLI